MSFVFFDTETTGLNFGFDQIIHFAAIRTDAALNEVERFEARSRLLPHVVPHPVALRTNGLRIARRLVQAVLKRITHHWLDGNDQRMSVSVVAGPRNQRIRACTKEE